MTKLSDLAAGVFTALIITLALWGVMEAAGDRLPWLVIAVGGLCTLGLAAGLGVLEKGLSGMSVRSLHRLIAALWLVLTAAQLAAAVSDFTPRNDLAYICTGAENIALRGREYLYQGIPDPHGDYFSCYPNNHLLTCVIYLLYRGELVLTGHISVVLPRVMNLAGLNLSYLLMCRCGELLYAPGRAAVCAVRGLLFTPLVTYVPFFYTDSMAMPLVTGAAYLYLLSRDRKHRSLPLILASGGLAGLGYCMKGSTGILLAAMCIDLLMHGRGRRVRTLIGVTAAFAAVSMAVSALSRRILGITSAELDQYRFPLVHWVMMSADGRGGYSQEDFLFTQSVQGVSDKTSADLMRLRDKLCSQGVRGFVMHLGEKLAYTWRDGSFMTGYYYSTGFFCTPAFYVISFLCHFTQLFTVGGHFAGGALGRRKVPGLLRLSFLGLGAFLLIWETRCRYLVSFFMLFVLI